MIEIHTFGGLSITRNGLPVSPLPTRKAEALLIYLACQGRPCPRGTLFDLLWNDRPETQAQTNLRSTLSRLNQHLPEVLTISRQTLAVNSENVWLDVATLEKALATPAADSAQTEEALALYRGDFLAGYAVHESRGFDDWLLLERERLRQRVIEGLETLIALHISRTQYAKGIAQARHVVMLDPLREEAHRQLMTLLALTGERGAALTQYALCRKVLAEELGIEPGSETRALSQQIERAEVTPSLVTKSEPIRLARFINSLPQHVGTRYIGQAQKQAEIREAIVKGARLVSIYGRGGVGKTALACQVLSGLQTQLKTVALNGVVALSALTTGISLNRILIDVGRLLGGKAEGLLQAVAHDAQTPLAQKVHVLLEQVQGERYVLFLDNLETLQDSETGALADLELRTLFEMALGQSSALCLFITSREPITLPRPLKTWEHRISLEEGLPVDEACTLLRALDAAGVAGLRGLPDAQLRRLAEQTHGFPRALESVVGLLLETPLLRPEDLLTDAELWTNEITPSVVQQAIARLNPEVIQVLEALALFNSPVPMAALEFLLAPYTQTSGLRPILNRLVRAFFVQFNKLTRHFALHPLDQAYCYSRLSNEEGITRRELHRRAAQFFRHQRSPQAEWTTVESLSPQLNEFEHLIQTGDHDAAAEVLLLVDRDYLWEWGQKNLLQTMYARLQGHLVNPHLARATQRRLGWTYWPNIARMVPLVEQNLDSARSDGDRQAEADALDNLAQVSRFQNNLQHAAELHEKAISLYRVIGDRRGEGDALGGLGAALNGLGQVESGLAYSQQALSIHRELNQQPSLGFTLWSMGMTYRSVGKFEQAIACHATAIGIFRELNAPRGEANNLTGLAIAYASLGQFEQAFDCLQQALERCRALQDRDGLGMVHVHWGAALLMKGDSHEAVEILKKVQALSIDNQVTLSLTNYLLTNSLIASNQMEAAQALIASTPVPPQARFGLYRGVNEGIIYARLGEPDRAQACFKVSLDHANKLLGRQSRFDVLYQRGLAQAGLALLEGDDDRFEAALVDFTAARNECVASGIMNLHRQLLEALMACPGGERLAEVRTVLVPASSERNTS